MEKTKGGGKDIDLQGNFGKKTKQKKLPGILLCLLEFQIVSPEKN